MTVNVPTHFGDLPVHSAVPTGEARGAVIVLHQAHGISPEVFGWLETLAAEGYVAVAPALHYRRGAESINPMEEFGGDLEKFSQALPTDTQFRGDFERVIQGLGELGFDPEKIGVVGSSYGGRAAYMVSREYPIAAAVSWYPVGIQNKSFGTVADLGPLPIDAGLSQAPWLGLSGDLDFLLQPGELDAWETELGASGKPVELVRYADAGHAFDIPGMFGPGAPESLNQVAKDDATKRTLAHLAAHVG